MKDKYAKVIENGPRISITTDKYTDSNNEKYLTVTVHQNVKIYDSLRMVKKFGSQTSEILQDLTEKNERSLGLTEIIL